MSCCFNWKRNLFLPQKATKETKTRVFVLLVVAADAVVVVAVVAPKQKCLKRRFCGLFVFRQKPSLKRSFFGSFSFFSFLPETKSLGTILRFLVVSVLFRFCSGFVPALATNETKFVTFVSMEAGTEICLKVAT